MRGSKLHENFVDDVGSKLIEGIVRDSVVGVDASWLQHKYLLPYQAEIRAGLYDRVICEFIDRVQRLTKCGIAVHVVFDGRKTRLSIRTRGLERAIIAALKHLGLRYTVAPYGAEAQFAHLRGRGDVGVGTQVTASAKTGVEGCAVTIRCCDTCLVQKAQA